MKGKRTNREEKRKFSKLYSLICILSLYKGNIEINQIIKKVSSSNKRRWYKILRITSCYMPYHFDCKLLSLSLYVFTLSPNYNIIKYEYVKFLKFPSSFTIILLDRNFTYELALFFIIFRFWQIENCLDSFIPRINPLSPSVTEININLVRIWQSNQY